MLRFFRAGLAAIQDVSDALREVRHAIQTISAERQGSGEVEDRVKSLELERAKWQAEMEALVLQAKGQFRSASNAEARERTMKESYDKQTDIGFDEGEGEFEEIGQRGLFPVNAQASEENGVQPVSLGVARSRKATAVNAKYGLK